MAHCQSQVFFPDDPKQLPQFSDCPRVAETTRRTFRIGDRAHGEPSVVNAVRRLCGTLCKGMGRWALVGDLAVICVSYVVTHTN